MSETPSTELAPSTNAPGDPLFTSIADAEFAKAVARQAPEAQVPLAERPDAAFAAQLF